MEFCGKFYQGLRYFKKRSRHRLGMGERAFESWKPNNTIVIPSRKSGPHRTCSGGKNAEKPNFQWNCIKNCMFPTFSHDSNDLNVYAVVHFCLWISKLCCLMSQLLNARSLVSKRCLERFLNHFCQQ